MKGYIIAALVITAAGLLIGCAAKHAETAAVGYTQITQDEAKEMMQKDDGHIIVDVRRQDEFASGHITGAVCIPNESIGQMKPSELPDLQQVILVYCRSGNRSKQASQKLADIGYTNVYEFGGIIDWTGEIVAEGKNTDSSDSTKSTVLKFDSFDGGGYEYTVTLEDPELVSFTEKHDYGTSAHEIQSGSPYDVVFSFVGLKEGQTEMTVSATSPIIEPEEYTYIVTVDNDLNVTITEQEKASADVTKEPFPIITVTCGDTAFIMKPEDNSSAEALIEKLCDGEVTLELSDYGGFEKVGDLPWALTTNDTEITTTAGDVILYQGDKLTIYYDVNTWNFTKLGHIDATKEQLLEAFGSGDVTVTLGLEWTE